MILKTYTGTYLAIKIDKEIRDSGLIVGFDGIIFNDGVLSIVGDSISDESSLDSLIAAHNPEFSEPEQAFYNLEVTVKKRREYCEELIERMKQRNVVDGINGAQGFWVHTRLRKHTFTFYDQEFSIDLMNLVISGDVELACIALQYFVPDDMTQSYHWLNTSRVNWLINEMKSFLGWP